MKREVEKYINMFEYTNESKLDLNKAEIIRKEMVEKLNSDINLNDRRLAKAYHLLALTSSRVKRYEDSIKASKKAIEYFKNTKNEYYLARAYSLLATTYLILDQGEEFKKNYLIAEKILKELNEYEDLAYLNSRVGVYIFRKGKIIPEIKVYLDKALENLGKFQSPLSPQMYIAIASTYALAFNDFDTSVELLRKALNIAKYYGDIHSEILILYYIGVGYVKVNMKEEAIELFITTLNDKKFKEFTAVRVSIIFDLIKVILENKIKLEIIEELFTECKKEIENLDFIKIKQYSMQLDLLIVEYYVNIKKDNLDESLILLNKSHEYYKQNKQNCIFTDIQYFIYQLYGDVYFNKENYKKAIEYHNIALEIATNTNNNYIATVYKSLAIDYEMLEDYKVSYEYMKKLNKLIVEVEQNDLVRKYINVQKEYEKLKAIDKDRESFFANLSHELKTPINIIYSSIQLLNVFRDKSDKQFKEYYLKHEKSVRINCLRMLKIVQNMIDINKIDCGSITPKFGNYNLVSLIEEITISVLSYVEIKKNNILFDTEKEEIYVKCDPYMIERILLNLLSNAIKFSKNNGDILVNIYKTGRYVVIQVKDNGIGIPDEMKEKIFSKFIQIDASLNRTNEGSGIGLTLVKSFVDIHNGYIELESTEGKGSDFKVFIPNIKAKDIDENESIYKYDIDSERVISELSDIYELY